MANNRRVYRVAEQIRNLVAQELIRMADPRFSLVTITSVVVSPDLRHAKVYWMVTGRDRIEEVDEAFESASGAFRKVLARELGVRFVPVVKFFYDDTFDTRDEVDRLLERARAESPSSELSEESNIDHPED